MRYSWHRPLLVLVASASLFAIMAPGALVRAAAADSLTIYVSPTGSDSNDGLSEATPFRTLQHASDWLCGGTSTCTGRGQPVVIRLAQTTFGTTTRTTVRNAEFTMGVTQYTAGTVWHYFDPQNTTTFEPWFYQPGDGWSQVSAHGGYPIFDGNFSVDNGFTFAPLTAVGAGNTGLQFYYTRWQRFNIAAFNLVGGLSTAVTSTGITVITETSLTVNGNTFYGNYFYRIGNYWNTAAHMGYGAITVSNSDRDVFINNHFVQVMNKPGDMGHVHALYISHGSSNALVQANEFTDITGDPVRQRDRSNGTLTKANRFTRAGGFAYADDWYCRPNTPASYCFPKEYRSYYGVFTGNTLRGLYPQGIVGTRTVYCFDIPGGLCPANRLRVS